MLWGQLGIWHRFDLILGFSNLNDSMNNPAAECPGDNHSTPEDAPPRGSCCCAGESAAEETDEGLKWVLLKRSKTGIQAQKKQLEENQVFNMQRQRNHHRTTKWVRKDLKDHLVPYPAMGRDASH